MVIGIAGFRPGSRATFVSAKVAKTMLAVVWPFGFPARFANTGGAQTRGACPESSRRAQTMRAFFPVSAALLGHITRPGETAEKTSHLILGDQRSALTQSPPVDWSVHLQGWAAGVVAHLVLVF